MSGILTERWVWIIILSLIAILVVPLIVVLVILALPPLLKVAATIGIVVLYGIAAGYKEWVINKREKQKV